MFDSLPTRRILDPELSTQLTLFSGHQITHVGSISPTFAELIRVNTQHMGKQCLSCILTSKYREDIHSPNKKSVMYFNLNKDKQSLGSETLVS